MPDCTLILREGTLTAGEASARPAATGGVAVVAPTAGREGRLCGGAGEPPPTRKGGFGWSEVGIGEGAAPTGVATPAAHGLCGPDAGSTGACGKKQSGTCLAAVIRFTASIAAAILRGSARDRASAKQMSREFATVLRRIRSRSASVCTLRIASAAAATAAAMFIASAVADTAAAGWDECPPCCMWDTSPL